MGQSDLTLRHPEFPLLFKLPVWERLSLNSQMKQIESRGVALRAVRGPIIPVFTVQGIKGKSVELLAPNRIVNSAKSSTDLSTHPSTRTVQVLECCGIQLLSSFREELLAIREENKRVQVQWRDQTLFCTVRYLVRRWVKD